MGNVRLVPPREGCRLARRRWRDRSTPPRAHKTRSPTVVTANAQQLRHHNALMRNTCERFPIQREYADAYSAVLQLLQLREREGGHKRGENFGRPQQRPLQAAATDNAQQCRHRKALMSNTAASCFPVNEKLRCALIGSRRRLVDCVPTQLLTTRTSRLTHCLLRWLVWYDRG